MLDKMEETLPSNITPIPLSTYSEVKLKQYKLVAEFRKLVVEAPRGVYLLPDKKNLYLLFGVLFIRQGFYKGGVFKFKIVLPKSYPEGYEAPLVLFFSDIFHPFIDPETKILNLSTKVKQLRGVSSLVCLLNYLKSIFYSKYLNEENVANPKAMELYKKDHLAYAKRAKQVVAKSLKEQYENDTESSLKFSKYVPEYEKVRKLILGKSHS